MKVAVVDGYSTGRLIATRLKAEGVTCIHVQSSKTTHPYYRRSFRPEDYDVDLEYDPDPDVVARRLASLGVDRVVAGTESGVTMAAVLGARIGGAHNDPERAEASTHKGIMAMLAREKGIRTPQGVTVDSVEEALQWAAARGLRSTVAKPATSAGSDNVRFCSDPAELAQACRAILNCTDVYGRPNRSVVVQEHIRGEEFYLNTVSHDGDHRVAETWKYTKRSGPKGNWIYDFEEPVPPTEPVWEVLRAFVCDVLDALGICSSPAHTEVMITEVGPVLIETGARLGGGTLPDVVDEICGLSQTSLFVRGILDHRVVKEFDDHADRANGSIRNVSLINPVAGVVRNRSWQEKIRKLPTLAGMAAELPPGYRLGETSNLIDSPGFIYLASPDPAAVRRDYARLRTLEANGLYIH